MEIRRNDGEVEKGVGAMETGFREHAQPVRTALS